MASPSWLPSWPSGWPDLESAYKLLAPGSLPRGLFASDSEPYADWIAIGESLAQARKLLEWVLKSYHPQRDSEALQLPIWESLLGLAASGTLAARQGWAIAKLRQRGTTTLSLAKAVMAGAWGNTDGSILSVHTNDPADLAANPQPTSALEWREAIYMHFYKTAEDEAPDWGRAVELIAGLISPWSYWTVGRYDVMEYDDADSGWDRGRWDN